MTKGDLISIEWTGFEDVKRALDKWGEDAIQAATKGTNDCLEDLLQKSQALAPKLSGDLEGSGTVERANANPITREISGSVGYNKVYAVRRHEEAYNPGPITRGKPGVDGMTPGRKYLEQPLVRYTSKYMEVIAAAIRMTTGG